VRIPGFTAESALQRTDEHYVTVATHEYVRGDQTVVSQMRASSFREMRGPFSGSCGCGPGVCCCIFCYFENCSWWCWSTFRM
jgi:hypothetical protein